MKTKLEKHGFIDQQRHRLENCQDYLDIVDVIEKAKKLIKEKSALDFVYYPACESWIYTEKINRTIKMFEKLKQAVERVSIDEEIKDKDTINYQLEKAGFSKKEQILILSIIDLVYRNREEFKP